MTLVRPVDGLGASDAAAILGVSRWHTALDVWNQKMGITKPEDKEEHQQWGLLLEPAIAARYSQDTGRRLRRIGTARSKDHPLLYAHPDRIVVGESGLVEIKVSRRKWDDGIPIYYKTQAIQQLICTDREWVDFAVLEGGQRFMTPIPRYERDRSIEADFIAELEDWWERHIVRREPPDMDGGEAGRRYLRATYPVAEVDEVIATAQMLPVVDRYRLANQNRKQIEASEEQAKQAVMQLIGDAQVLSGPFGKIVWTRYTQKKVDWKAVATDLEKMIEPLPRVGDRIQMTGKQAVEWVRSMHTSEVPATRLTPTWKQEESDD